MYKVVSHYYEDDTKIKEFREKSNIAWTDHFMYTRNAIISILNNTPDVAAVVDRLMKNQEDIGNLLRPYYSATIVDQYVNLLKQHINIAAQYVTAVRDHQPTADIEAAWTANGQDIVNWKSSVNPWNWPRSKIEPLWVQHMNTTISEISSRANGDWASDIAAADSAYTVIRQIAQSFADGVIYQSIENFAKPNN